MGDKIDVPMGGLGGLVLLGGAAALTYYLWPKGSPGARPGGSPGGGTVVPSSTGTSSPRPSSPASSPGTSYTSPGTSEATPSTADSSSWEESPQGQAAIGGSPTWYTPGDQTGPTWYNSGNTLMGLGAYDTDPRPVQYMALADQVQRAQSLIDAAYSNWTAGIFTRIVGGTQNVADMVASSSALASTLVSALRDLASNPDATYDDGSRKDTVVTSVAANYVGGANSIIQTIGSQSFTSEMFDFVARFPRSLQTVLSYTVDAAGNVVAGAAWGVSKMVLILGLGVAAVALLMRYSGVSLNTGPVRIKAKE